MTSFLCTLGATTIYGTIPMVALNDVVFLYIRDIKHIQGLINLVKNL